MCYLLLRLCPFPQFPLLQKDHFLSPAIVLWVRRKVAPVQPRILLSSECVASAFYVHWIHITRSTVSRHVLLGLSFLPGGWEHYQGWCDSSNFLQRLLGVYHTVAKKEENMASLTFNNLPQEKKNRIVKAAVKEFSRVPLEKALISNIIKDADTFFPNFTATKLCIFHIKN